MAVTTGFDITMKILTGGTCTCSSDALTITGATCTTLPYMDSYTVNGSIENIDVTAFGDKIRKRAYGFPEVSADFSGGLDLTNAVQLAFANSLTCSTRIPRILRIGDGGKTTTIKGLVSGHTRGGSVGGKSTFSGSISATYLVKTC